MKEEGKRIVVRLKDVHCKNTEDMSGTDEFYIAGGGGTGPDSGRTHTAILTKPIEISKGQTSIFPPEESVVFDGRVHANDFIEISLQFFDEDFKVKKDFDDKYKALVAALATAVGAAVTSVGTPVAGAVAAAIFTATVPALLKVLESIDKDDTLGIVEKRIELKDLKPGSNGPFSWHFTEKENVIREGLPKPHERFPRSEEIGYSDWGYTVRYEIDVSSASA
ncbi:hypothetical protein ACFU99_05290 [Streptomyces sp. NPDC057654]|uniref:hypothetical protein n=1 Tax=Streptomyces sp. NPDC057654 TaxID=3346196 RepID=UPI0036C05376